MVLKMDDNHLRNLYCHHMLKHGGNNFPYFDYNVKNKTSELIKADANVKQANVARKLTEIDSKNKIKRYACNKGLTNMSVRKVRF